MITEPNESKIPDLNKTTSGTNIMASNDSARPKTGDNNSSSQASGKPKRSLRGMLGFNKGKAAGLAKTDSIFDN